MSRKGFEPLLKKESLCFEGNSRGRRGFGPYWTNIIAGKDEWAMKNVDYPSQAMSPRLHLRAMTSADLDRVHALLADARVWTHLPSGVHRDRKQTEDMLARYLAAWEQHGLGYWMAEMADGTFVGIGGCTRKPGPAWNLYYRFVPEFHGQGFATELALTAIEAAKTVDKDLPVVALLLEHNRASEAVAKKIGLRLAWQGPAMETGDPTMTRLIYRTTFEFMENK